MWNIIFLDLIVVDIHQEFVVLKSILWYDIMHLIKPTLHALTNSKK